VRGGGGGDAGGFGGGGGGGEGDLKMENFCDVILKRILGDVI